MRDDATRPYYLGDASGSDHPTDEIELPHSPAAAGPATTPMPASGIDEPWPESGAGRRGEQDPTIAMPPAPSAPAPQYSPPPAVPHVPASPQAPAGPAPQARPAAPAAPAAPRPAAPHLIRRIIAPVLAVPLHITATLLAGLGIAGAFASIFGVTGEAGAFGTVAAWALAAGAALAFFLCAATARISATGTVIAGIGGVLLGIIGFAWPDAFAGWVASTPAGSEALAEVIGSASQVVSVVMSIIALSSGAVLLGASVATHGARRAGWKRGAGR